MIKVFTVLVVLALSGSAFGQFVDQADLEQTTRSNSLGQSPVDRPFSLLDLSRIRWSNSYTISFFSGNGNSGSMGLLNTTMFYEFSRKLSLAVNVGIAHNTGAIWGDGNNSATILPSFMLDYHPSKNFQISIGMQTFNGGYYPYSNVSPFRHNYFGP